jgi:hypothetical protein
MATTTLVLDKERYSLRTLIMRQSIQYRNSSLLSAARVYLDAIYMSRTDVDLWRNLVPLSMLGVVHNTLLC